MANKRKRGQANGKEAEHDLPPADEAQSTSSASKPQQRHADKKRKRAQSRDDDTPRAFARIMQYQKTGKKPSGLDEGDQPSKKKRRRQRTNDGEDSKQDKQASGQLSTSPQQSVQKRASESGLKILPGERMTDFSARVNHALPISGLSHKGKKVEGMQEHRTRLEKKITKRQDAWRKAEERRKEKQEEALDAEEEGDEVDYWGQDDGEGKLSKRKRRLGEGRNMDDDPWAKLQQVRDKPRGLHDVAQAPPSFRRLPKEKFKVRPGALKDVADITEDDRYHKKQAELMQNRKAIINNYKHMMKAKQEPLEAR